MPSGEKPSVRHIRVIPPFLTSDMTVAAIDIGTSFSGLAYSCTDRICTLTWNRYPPNYKTPSVVLFDEEERFDSFGYDAENKYAYLVDDDEHLDWHLFQNFKMKLYTGREILDDGNGRTMDAVEVMSAVLSYFNKEVLDHFRRLNYHVRADDIHWVLTICTDSHAHFIRNAAMQAGIHQEHLQILHEVEAASVYCQHGAVDDVNRRMPPGTKYITIEMGGGTVVIAVCKVPIEENNVLYTESYTDCGGTMVDARFFEFMASLTGEEVFSKFCRDNKEDHLELRRNFEQAKRGLDNLSTGELKIRIPRGLLDTLKNETGKDFKEILKESNYRDNVTLKMRSLFIDIQIIRDLFTCCCQNIVRHITDVLATRDAKGIKLLFLTGGFSESQIMQNAIASAFSTTLVLVPEQADLAVLKGAVMFGNHPHQPDTIRVFKNTYGIEITPVFDPTLHSESHRVSINGQYRCKNVFRKFVGIGETSLITDVFCHEHATLFPFQTSIVLKIFASSAKNPLYVDEPGVTKIGELTVELPWREKSVINIKFNFGRTQLQVTAVDLTNGESKRLSLKFLG